MTISVKSFQLAWLKRVIAGCFLGGLIGMTSAAYASADSKPHAVEVGLGFAEFDYKESDTTGRPLNTEKGALNSFFLSSGLSQGAHVFSVTLSLNVGAVQYIGLTNRGRSTRTTTDERISDVLFRYDHLLGRPILPSSIYTGFGYRYWRRDIQSTAAASGVLERYRWPYIIAGIKKERFFGAHSGVRWGVSADLGVKYSHNPRIQVDFLGIFDSLSVTQGATWGGIAKISLFRQAGEKKWSVTPYIDYWHAQRGESSRLLSSGSVIGAVVEPKSRTVLTGVNVTLSF